VLYPDPGSASKWLKENSLTAQPIRSTTKIWVVHVISMEISALVTQTLFSEGSSGDLAKRRLFSQAIFLIKVCAFWLIVKNIVLNLYTRLPITLILLCILISILTFENVIFTTCLVLSCLSLLFVFYSCLSTDGRKQECLGLYYFHITNEVCPSSIFVSSFMADTYYVQT